MNSILKIKFENLLSRKDIEILITSQNCFKTSSLIYKHINKYLSFSKDFTDNDEYFYLIIAKLFNDSLDSLHEDSLELLELKHKEKINDFQSKKSISEYLPQVRILCQSYDIEETTITTTTTTSEIFTTTEESSIKSKSSAKSTKKSIKKISDEIKKPSKILSAEIDEQSLVQDIKKIKDQEAYSDVEFNDEDNKMIDNIFFD